MTRRTMRLALGVAAAAAFVAAPAHAGTSCTEHTPWACVEKILESIT